MAKKNAFILGRLALFQAGATIKFQLRDAIYLAKQEHRLLRKLVDAFHVYMDNVFGEDRPRTYVWV